MILGKCKSALAYPSLKTIRWLPISLRVKILQWSARPHITNPSPPLWFCSYHPLLAHFTTAVFLERTHPLCLMAFHTCYSFCRKHPLSDSFLSSFFSSFRCQLKTNLMRDVFSDEPLQNSNSSPMLFLPDHAQLFSVIIITTWNVFDSLFVYTVPILTLQLVNCTSSVLFTTSLAPRIVIGI